MLPSTTIAQLVMPGGPGHYNSSSTPSSGFFNTGPGGNSGFGNYGSGLSGWFNSNVAGLSGGSGFSPAGLTGSLGLGANVVTGNNFGFGLSGNHLIGFGDTYIVLGPAGGIDQFSLGGLNSDNNNVGIFNSGSGNSGIGNSGLYNIGCSTRARRTPAP